MSRQLDVPGSPPPNCIVMEPSALRTAARLLTVRPPGPSPRKCPFESWSLSVHDSNGHFLGEGPGGRTVNSRAAVRNADGSITMQFGGGEPGTSNCLLIARGWCYVVRLYRP